MRGLKRVAAIAAVAGGVLAATASVAGAQAYEPNDSFTQAYGPLLGGQNYDAAERDRATTRTGSSSTSAGSGSSISA